MVKFKGVVSLYSHKRLGWEGRGEREGEEGGEEVRGGGEGEMEVLEGGEDETVREGSDKQIDDLPSVVPRRV